jgi:hypothetical protein
MGIVVETSIGGRSRAALAADAVRDDARKDEDHACDADQVSGVLAAEPLVSVVAARRAEMDHDVENSTHGHERQTDEDHERKPPGLPRKVYRKHTLVIQIASPAVNCIDSVRV